MQFYVPTIGDSLFLSQPWEFTLHQEHRNQKFAQVVGDIIQNETFYSEYRVFQLTRDFSSGNSWQFGRITQRAGQHRFYVYSEADRTMSAREFLAYYRCVGYDVEGLWIELAPERTPYQVQTWQGNEFRVTLPARTQLIVDRIYIKKGAPDFDSITFRIGECPNKAFRKKRFWVKLRDANRIVCELTPIADIEAPVARSRFANLG
jgi:hypothetical protein